MLFSNQDPIGDLSHTDTLFSDVGFLAVKAKAKSKSDLPTKICPVCNRPFTWRKKWAECWDRVKYCSERCRRRKSKIDKQIDK